MYPPTALASWFGNRMFGCALGVSIRIRTMGRTVGLRGGIKYVNISRVLTLMNDKGWWDCRSHSAPRWCHALQGEELKMYLLPWYFLIWWRGSLCKGYEFQASLKSAFGQWIQEKLAWIYKRNGSGLKMRKRRKNPFMLGIFIALHQPISLKASSLTETAKHSISLFCECRRWIQEHFYYFRY